MSTVVHTGTRAIGRAPGTPASALGVPPWSESGPRQPARGPANKACEGWRKRRLSPPAVPPPVVGSVGRAPGPGHWSPGAPRGGGAARRLCPSGRDFRLIPGPVTRREAPRTRRRNDRPRLASPGRFPEGRPVWPGRRRRPAPRMTTPMTARPSRSAHQWRSSGVAKVQVEVANSTSLSPAARAHSSSRRPASGSARLRRATAR